MKQPVDSLILSKSVRAAVTGFARTLANEVAELGITVNNIMPGYTRTERVEELAASIAEQKGIVPAMQACFDVAASGDDWQFVVAGPDEFSMTRRADAIADRVGSTIRPALASSTSGMLHPGETMTGVSEASASSTDTLSPSLRLGCNSTLA